MRILIVASLLLAACAASTEFTPAESSGLTFIHLNDTYRIGAVEDGNRGGFGRVVTVIKELQAEGREVRVLHAGDVIARHKIDRCERVDEIQRLHHLQTVPQLTFE